MNRLSVTIEPWVHDSHNIELRITVEERGREYTNIEIVQLEAFESLFDRCLEMGGRALKKLLREELEGKLRAKI